MGTVTEFIAFINNKEVPGDIERRTLFTHISIDSDKMDERKEYRKRLCRDSEQLYFL